MHVEGRYKGGVYVQLSQAQQHVEHIYVDNIASMNYQGFCGVAFDVPAGEKVINPGECTAVPSAPAPAAAAHGTSAALDPAVCACAASAPYMSTGTNIASQFAVNNFKPGIPAGTAMPTDSFLTSTSK